MNDNKLVEEVWKKAEKEWLVLEACEGNKITAIQKIIKLAIEAGKRAEREKLIEVLQTKYGLVSFEVKKKRRDLNGNSKGN